MKKPFLEAVSSNSKRHESKPLVSIIINNYNYGKFLEAAINSAINQTYELCEVVVVDDGSTDDSQQVIESYGQKIISLIKENGGQASAFNAGFSKSKGEIICFLDADDVFQLNKVEEVVASFNQYPEADWCYHPLKMVDINHKELNSEVADNTSDVYDIRPYITRGKLRGKIPFTGPATSGMCFRRSLLDELLPMPEEIRITSDDYLKYAGFGISRGIFLLKKLALQTIHDTNAYTLRKDKEQTAAQIAVLTAYWLRRKYPVLAPFTNKIFAYGVGTLSNQGIEVRFREIINKYTDSLKLTEIIAFYIRVIYYRLLKEFRT